MSTTADPAIAARGVGRLWASMRSRLGADASLRPRHSLLLVLVWTIAFASYFDDAFGVTSRGYFETTGAGSALVVLDGLARERAGDGPAVMGQYSRTGVAAESEQAYALYRDDDRSGRFERYRSNFGLQLDAIAAFARAVGYELALLQALVATTTAMIVVALFHALRRDRSTLAAAAACAVLVLCPWMVELGRNLYFVPATWFLPLLVTVALGRAALGSDRAALGMASLLGAAFLLRFLCGYEYCSTIGVAAVVPLACFAAERAAWRRGAILAAAAFGAFVIALALAFQLHALRIGGGDATAGYRNIQLTARYSIAPDDPMAIATEICAGSPIHERCLEENLAWLERTTQAHLWNVVPRYVLMAPRMLPWLNRGSIEEREKAKVRALRAAPSISGALTGPNALAPRTLLQLGLLALGAAAFLAFLVTVVTVALRRRSPTSWAALVAAAAPLSWYVLAAAHSYNHYHLNFVLWLVPFAPVGMLLLMERAPRAPRG